MKRLGLTEMIQAKYPEQVTIVVTVGECGRANVIPLSWVTQVSLNPHRFVVAIGNEQYSQRLLEQSGEFVLAFPNKTQAREVVFCGTRSGRSVNKELESGFTFIPSTQIAPPLVEGCLSNLECKLISQHNAGDHTLYVGEVVAAHIEKEAREKTEGMYYLGGELFGSIRKIETLEEHL
ncbi:flavin reductase family protein [Candidatus Bipolaricaulota bacterium]